MSTQEQLFKESQEFISKHIHSSSDVLPAHLIGYWSIKETDDIYNSNLQSTSQWSVFMYALMKYKLSKGQNEFSITPEKLISLFEDWQSFLAIAEINLVADIKTKPITIFDFDNYEKIRITILP